MLNTAMNTDYSTVRWGILGPGSIAKRFATGLKALPDAPIAAVASRTPGKADAFADEFGVPRRYSRYEELVADPEVDVVYVATPHSHHKEHSLLALEAGKPVLCEKPFTINAGEAEEIVRAAREKKVFLMEAMWSRFFPLTARVREMLNAGAIGEVRMLEADFGFRAGKVNPEARLFNPALGGGALLDVGVYTVSFASMILGTPSRITGMASLGETGVDEQSAMLLGYPGGQLAVLSTAIRTNTPHEASIIGTDGYIRLHRNWWTPSAVTLVKGGNEERIEMPFEGNGFNYEAAEVAACLRAGKLESDVMPLDESVSVMRTLDQVREQWGLKYPMEG